MSDPANPAAGSPPPGGAPPPPAGGSPPPAAPTPPQGPLASYWDATKNALNLEKLTADYVARDEVFAKHTERAKHVPAKPEEYKAALPEDVKLPEGYELKFDDKAIGEARTLAHAAGIDQPTFSKLLGVVVRNQIAANVAAITEHKAMVAEEVKKMGGEEATKARHAPIETYIAGNFNPEEQGELRLLLATEAGTRTLERLIAKANGNAMPGRLTEGQHQPTPETVEQRWYGPMKAKG